MSRIALLDVNVLAGALQSQPHAPRDRARLVCRPSRARWATCAVTQNGFIRVFSNTAARAGTFRPAEVVDLLRRFCSAKEHVFWPDAVSLTDSRLFNPSLIRGYRQVSDIYLLGLAKKMGGYLATFDGGIPLGAVIGATSNTIAVISAWRPRRVTSFVAIRPSHERTGMGRQGSRVARGSMCEFPTTRPTNPTRPSIGTPLDSAPAMLRDLRHGFRVLLQAKGWTAVVVLSLAVGIGANAAIFSAVNGLLLRKLPVARS